ncbi:unnamed protein product [Periconia digitata]|uniref:Uncharacterized protein n=1 Tax=Periconia digitata TaxID=1303443 RepID=A0A9W4UJC2_9PLEO|nr:unnamed protein product [Periconia digitata]
MEHIGCECSATSRQRVADCLGQEKLPLDRILEAGSELCIIFGSTTDCNRCIKTKRISKWLIQMTIRLICFYEAAINQTLPSRTPPATSGEANSLSLQQPSTTMGFPEMRFGEVHIEGPEGHLLIKLALVEACSHLNETIQIWKMTSDESLEAADQKHLVHYNDRVLGRCLDLLAKLIGLLRLDGLMADQS